jgi:hypothetical protein
MLSTPTRKVEKRPTTLIVLVVVFTLTVAIEIVNVLPRLPYWQIGVTGGLILMTISFLAITTSRDPGYLDSSKTDFLDLLEVFDPA